MVAIQAEMEQARLESTRTHANLMAQNQQNLAHNQQFMSIIHNLQERPQVLYAAPEACMPMLTNLMPPPSSRHDVYIQEHVYPTPVLVVPASLQVIATLEPSFRHASADT